MTNRVYITPPGWNNLKHRKTMKRLICVVALSVMAFAPGSFAQNDSGGADTITITGRIERYFIGGGAGFYGIKADDGTEYRPERLSNEFQREGLRVKATARISGGGKGLLTKGWEVPVEIIQIERER
jgi:hypothetical protein